MVGLRICKFRSLAIAGVLSLIVSARAQPYSFSTLAGVGCGNIDGTNSAARFFYPKGAALDSSGNLYFADSGNHTIRKITSVGAVITLAGLAGSPGSANGTNNTARFYNPSGVAVDANGNVYVADTGNHTIRMVTPAGVVTTLAGLAGNYGAVDGAGNAARFFHPMRVALDAGGNLYVADTYNQLVRKVSLNPRSGAWVVSTLAGTAGVTGSADGSSALFNNPWDLVVDGNANVYVADAGNATIRMITALGVTSTLAGKAGSPGTIDGTNSGARFAYPCAITMDGNGILYVADGGAFTIRSVAPGGIVTTLAGLPGVSGNVDGSGGAALFNYPCGLVADGAGANIYVADTGNNTVRKLATAGRQVTTLAGLPAGISGSADGTNSTARFLAPQAVAVDPAGNVYAVDTGNNTIRKITPAGVVSTLAGSPTNAGYADGTNGAARFWRPTGIALDAATNLYVADNGNQVIRKITPAGVVTTLAGSPTNAGYADGTNGAARFANPSGIAADAAGNLYVSDFGNCVVRKITPGGLVSTFAGNPATNGSADGSNTLARFLLPCGVAVDSSSNVYVADTGNHTIRKITPMGVVTTLAGLADIPGANDGTNSAAQFCFPHGIAVDASTNLYVADTFNSTVRKITPAGLVSTVAGTPGSYGVADDKGPGAQFFLPYGIAVDGASNLYVADNFNNSIREGVIYNPPIITGNPSNQTVLGGTTVTFSAAAEGSGALSYQWQTNGVNIAGATNASLVLGSATLANNAVYGFIVTSAFGSVTSQVATLNVLVPANDAFANAIALTGTNFNVTGTNIGATKERNEPNHAGNSGGHSVWWSWTAPVNGTMTLNTFGSSFDTLLAVYTGSSVSALTPVVSDDDYGTNLTSLVVFGAKAGVTYRIAVDGYNGASGSIQLNLAWAPPVFPAISSSWQPQVDIPGATVAFSAVVSGSPPLSLQWTKGGANISGATSSTLILENISAADATNYALLVSDQLSNAVSATATLSLTNGLSFRTLAGTSGYGSVDGTGATARFHQPVDIIADPANNLYVADSLNDTIRKITPEGIVSTLAGLPGVSGGSDGTNSGARFNYPAGVALDAFTNLYVADALNDAIRKITPAGVVTTFAGLAGYAGSSDGAGSNARFNTPSGVAVDGSGIIYVADSGNDTIRSITPAGVVTTLAGIPGVFGSYDGPASNAIFNYPECIRVDASTNLYVADTQNNTIRKITPAGIVSTLAGTPDLAGSMDGPATNALFRSPEGLGLDSATNIYVADTGNDTARKITRAGVVSTLAGQPGVIGNADGPSNTASFSGPTGIGSDSFGNLFLNDNGNNTIRKISTSGGVSTLAGTVGAGTADGAGVNARFNYPAGVASDSAGNVYVCDYVNETIRKVTPAGVVTTLAGLAGTPGSADGTNAAARFSHPSGLAADPSGNLYVADNANNTIRRITPAGAVTTFAGLAGTTGSANGTGSTARFNGPLGVAVDLASNVYVTDAGNFAIRKITPAAVVTTLAGSAGNQGYLDGPGTNAWFASPAGIVVDGFGNVYVADSLNYAIREITPAGTVTTLAGHPGSSVTNVGILGGYMDGTGATALFGYPFGLALDSATNLIVVDLANNNIRRVTPQGVVSTLAGSAGIRGAQDGTGVAALFSSPQQITADSAGYLYVADSGNYSIRTTSPGPPNLQLNLAANYAVLSWPAYATGYVVQASASFPSIGSWISLTNIPVVTIGTNFVQSNPISAGSVFYRLYKSQ
jgi:sugar lactone lactonase YvrE